jgi:hypothetical protein
MTIQPLATVDLNLQPQLQWLWYSNATHAVISGDEKDAYSLSTANPTSPNAIEAGGSSKSACNLPIADTLKDEFLSHPCHGLRFLDRAAYDGIDADILRTLVFGPNYNVPMLHPPSGAILALQSSAMQLLIRAGQAFTPIDRTKPRGKAALAFAAHPAEPLIVYGDNNGTFTAHRFGPTKFGKATKIAEKERKASQIGFIAGGTKLLIGGMGYLATFAYEEKQFSPLHEVSAPVRDFRVADHGQTIVVNQGMHGVSIYRCDETGRLTKQAEVKPPGPVQFVAASADLKHLAATHTGVARVSVYSIS